jgi:hypothetical protein
MPRLVLLTLAVLAAMSSPAAAESSDMPSRIGFNRDVRPILSDKCFRCHGPDAASRAADLRLDVREAVTAIRDGHAAVVPGKPEASELFKRITTADTDTRMPPADSELVLTAAEREVLRRWIAEGAEYEPHWAFVPPHKAAPPKVQNAAWVRNPIDAFVLARLEREKLSPSPEADAATLCRRLHLDLTGIPPTPEQVAKFVREFSPSPRLPHSPSGSEERESGRAGDSEKAYSALVDALLASPRYGERMAGPWLDAARYADTNGYQTDGPRQMWRWRDWVIEAFNRNLPYDQFTIEQLAGDLLPSPTLDQRIATGFNRNHRMNAEGGIIPEEFLVEYVVDRVETTATVWLGLTLGCARCHDHKYDPFSQREFYRLFAFFNNVPEPGKAVRDDNSPPFIPAPTRVQQARLKQLDAAVADAEKRWNALQPQIATAERKWVGESQRLLADWTITEGLLHRYRFDGNVNDDVVTPVPDPEIPAEEQPQYAGGPFAEALVFDGSFDLRFAKPLEFDSERPFSSAVWIKPEKPTSTVYAAMDPDQSYIGVELRMIDGSVEVILSNRILDDAIRVRTKQKLPLNTWSHVAWTYDGVKLAERVRVYLDGKPVETETLSDTLSNKFTATASVQVGGGGTRDDFRGRLADLRFYNRQLPADEAAIVYCGLSLRGLVQAYDEDREPAVRVKLREYFLRFVADGQIKAARQALQKAQAERAEFMQRVPTTMVMHEVPGLRKTHLLKRGEYDKPGEAVTAGVPDALPVVLSSGATVDRLTLARWLVDRRHPLTARVAVNRLWQQLFGIGLVKTVEDFGAQGEAPSHPELLDWLAVEFIDRGWDMKQLLKLIVTSAAYRQSSHVSPELRARDPENRLLARGARFRLSAEAVRDSALAVSGLLVERLGGPSVKPYQPFGLWEELATGTVRYEQDHGDDLYRRGLYVYRKRAVAPPGLLTFDAAAREACVVRQTRTNTPLQALNLLNDVTFVEAARALATRMLRDGGSSADDQIAYGFRLALGRDPTHEEAAILHKGYQRRLAEFRQDQGAAEKLIKQGESPIDAKLDAAELAALTTVGNVLLNLDEFVTRQ